MNYRPNSDQTMSPRPRKQIDTTTYEGRFAVRLKMLREKAKLTVEQFAEAIGVKPITVYGWEQGRSSPHISNLPAIAEAFEFKRVRDILPER